MIRDEKTNNVVQLIAEKIPQSIEALNRATGLNWTSQPKSLLPNGLVIGEAESTTPLQTPARKQA